MSYPHVYSEIETIERAHAGANLARYGDGELNICLGHNCISQPYDKRLAAEMREILKSPAKGCLPCIPNAMAHTKAAWQAYTVEKYTNFYDPARSYGSSFVTRSDSAPWIDAKSYWERIKDFWRDKDTALVIGTNRSLRPENMIEAASVRVFKAHSGQGDGGAWQDVDRLEQDLKAFSGPVIMCLGATATVLANRLARHGVHAQDLGHMGRFMRAAGAYRYLSDDLTSPEYRDMLRRKHKTSKWGRDGHKHAEAVRQWASALGAEAALDYGAGRQSLAASLPDFRIDGYDPGVEKISRPPKPHDLVVCTDVLEHVEPEKLDAVLSHIKCIALKGAYFVIATRPARGVLPDGRNAHLQVKGPKWWLKGLENAGFSIVRSEVDEGREIRVWTRSKG